MFHDCIYAGTEKKSAEKGVELAKTSVNGAGSKEQFVSLGASWILDNTSRSSAPPRLRCAPPRTFSLPSFDTRNPKEPLQRPVNSPGPARGAPGL